MGSGLRAQLMCCLAMLSLIGMSSCARERQAPVASKCAPGQTYSNGECVSKSSDSSDSRSLSSRYDANKYDTCDDGLKQSGSDDCTSKRSCSKILPGSEEVKGKCRCQDPYEHWIPKASSDYEEKCYHSSKDSDEIAEIKSEGGEKGLSSVSSDESSEEVSGEGASCKSEQGTFYEGKCYCGGEQINPFDPEKQTCDGNGFVTDKE